MSQHITGAAAAATRIVIRQAHKGRNNFLTAFIQQLFDSLYSRCRKRDKREAVFREVLTKLGAEMEEALLLPPRALLPQATVVSLQSHGHGNADRTAPLAMCPEHRCRRVA